MRCADLQLVNKYIVNWQYAVSIPLQFYLSAKLITKIVLRWILEFYGIKLKLRIAYQGSELYFQFGISNWCPMLSETHKSNNKSRWRGVLHKTRNGHWKFICKCLPSASDQLKSWIFNNSCCCLDYSSS